MSDLICAVLDDLETEGRVLPATDALRAVLDLHRREDLKMVTPRNPATHGQPYSQCARCSDGGDGKWPCATVAAIAEHLGVTEGANACTCADDDDDTNECPDCARLAAHHLIGCANQAHAQCPSR